MAWLKDFHEVDLDKVASPNLGDNWQGSKGYSRQEIEGWARQLGEVQALARNRGIGYDEFTRMRSSPDPYERTLGDTHHHFYDHSGNTHLKLSWGGDHYTIDNGRHRIQAAKQLGLRTVPAEVSAEEPYMNQCRAQGMRTPLLSPAERERDDRHVAPVSGGATPAANLALPDKPIWERGVPAQPTRKERLDR